VYQLAQFGFPLTAAVSRIHRLIDLFGRIERVSAQVRYGGKKLPHSFSSCFCHALLEFANGCVGEVGYHKGEQVWQSERILEVHGEQGGICFRGDWGKLVTKDGEQEVQTETAKGLFLKDTHYFLGHLLENKPNYTNHKQVLQAIATAHACELSAQNHQWMPVQEVL
jgi:biliverdin reductase